ncbi:HAD-like domain-containing protein [Infundibulicybe gibba]|nr:HAD-like domain-containing protein [Infundibulicybe gibba]
MSVRLSSKDQYEQLLNDYDTWMFDCNGVLWRGDGIIDGVSRTLDILRSHRKRIIFVTNNARDPRKQLIAKFQKIGVKAHMDEIFSSAYATAVYLSSVVQLPQSKKVYVIGMSGLEEELKAEGIAYAGGTSPEDCTLDPFSLSDFTLDPDVAAVVCGLDTNITYTKLSKAFQYLTRNPGCQFIATNEDKKYPRPGGFLPGAGAVSAPLRYALGKDPLCIGKPAATMMDCIRAKSVHPSRLD